MHIEGDLRNWLQRFLRRRMFRETPAVGAFANNLFLFDCYLQSQAKAKSWPHPVKPFRWLWLKSLCLLSNRLVLRQVSRERR